MSNICTIVCKIVVYQHRRIFHFFTFLALLLATNEKSHKVEKFMDNLLMHYPYREIAKKVGDCSASAAWKTVKREEVHHTRKSLPRSGRPLAIDTRTECRVTRELKKNRFMPYQTVADRLGGVTARQVQHVATSAGYHRRIARCKPFLTEKAIQERQKWATENKGRDWSKIIWTDEAKIETGERPGHRRVMRSVLQG